MAGRPCSEDSKRIGFRMKQILKQKNITQEKAAFRLGLSAQATLNSYINGRTEIPLNIINCFCTEFKVHVTTLFANDDIDVGTQDNIVIDIMFAIDEFLNKKHLALTNDQRRNLVKNFLTKGVYDPTMIKDTLSALYAIDSESFTKK